MGIFRLKIIYANDICERYYFGPCAFESAIEDFFSAIENGGTAVCAAYIDLCTVDNRDEIVTVYTIKRFERHE
jgi:hypothetical protein